MASESLRERRKIDFITQTFVNARVKERYIQIREILKKDSLDRTLEEWDILNDSQDVVDEIKKRARRQELAKERVKEVLDPPHVLEEKVSKLTGAIREAQCLVVYTGAGISTAASIPDYRGPNGVWTRLSRGENLGHYNLCEADPTLTHMSITKLHREGLVKHVVSQNCDGLHIRSGFPKENLSEVHGNMFAEVCTECDKERLYFRLFDVTENTGLRRHWTGRNCYYCGSGLRDTIVHFGEKGLLEQPLNWEGAIAKAKCADVILCLGSSLKVLKRYRALWGMNRIKPRRPKLFIVNLQWTPKDDVATEKINGKCDEVMKILMEKLGYGIPQYQRNTDPFFSLATPIRPYEVDSFTTSVLGRSLSCPENTTSSQSSSYILPEPSEQASEMSGSSPLQASECPSPSSPNIPAESSSAVSDVDSSETFNQSVDCERNGHGKNIKRKSPGWFGKGYAKNRKIVKKRKL